MEVSINGGILKSSILIGFSIINHPFRGTPFMEPPTKTRIDSHSFFRSAGLLYCCGQPDPGGTGLRMALPENEALLSSAVTCLYGIMMIKHIIWWYPILRQTSVVQRNVLKMVLRRCMATLYHCVTYHAKCKGAWTAIFQVDVLVGTSWHRSKTCSKNLSFHIFPRIESHRPNIESLVFPSCPKLGIVHRFLGQNLGIHPVNIINIPSSILDGYFNPN